VAQGRAIFEVENCASCHVGSAGTDLTVYDVGTGGTFDTPTLRWLWLSPPYLHDGRAQTLADVFQHGDVHNLLGRRTLAEIDALAAWLLSLPQNE
jgi:cytochrome c peroxidase